MKKGGAQKGGKRPAQAPPPSKQQDAKPQEDEAEELDVPSQDLDLPVSDEDEDADVQELPSGSEEEDADDEEGEEVRHAMVEYMAAAAQARHAEQQAAARRQGRLRSSEGPDGAAAAQEPNGAASEDEEEGEDGSGRPLDPGSDSSEDERENRNTIGNVPLEWYKNEDHIGYDKDGKRIAKSQRKDRLEQLLDRNDNRKALRTIYDEYNDEEITLTKEELRMIMAIRKGHFPHVEINPYEPYNDWFTREQEKVPFNDGPVPKRRFIPSKHEEKTIVKLVRAIRKGWLKTSAQKEEAKAPEVYLLWGDDGMTESSKTGVGLAYIPPAKPKLPGHEQSYNPPAEYLPTEVELASYELMDPEDRPKFVPTAYKSLREVPMYSRFINEVFERCLDLYLCPRVRKKRMHIDPESLVPKLPKPADLQPFPTTLAIKYEGHSGKVRCVAPDASGQWLLSGADDGCIKLWEVRSGRCMRSWDLGAPVHSVAWCPAPGPRIISAASGNRIVLLPPGVGSTQEVDAEAEQALSSALAAAAAAGLQGPGEGAPPAENQLAAWSSRQGGGIEITHRFPVRSIVWHGRGDYFATVAPTGNTQAVLVHQLSKGATQNPFRKNKGRVAAVLFHPSKPFFFVASANHVRVYNLAKQSLAKRLMGGSGTVTSMAIHPTGDHVLVGSEDRRLAWYDLDLGDKPYKALRYHAYAVRGTACHRTYPLFASSSDDGTAHVFHGMVYSDLMTNPLLVPLKILRGHAVVDYSGVLDCAFHPTQPWLFTAGADSTVCLFCN